MTPLPFKVGQEAECKSFIIGYRGAWFRCKIHDTGMKRGVTSYFVEYFDFTDEKKSWVQIYQKPIHKEMGTNLHLMMRPSFPAIYKQSQMPDASMISDTVVVVTNEWKIGDLVDWWTDGCYWSGKILELFGNDKVRIELTRPPLGEGEVYETDSQNLRPSLNWSPSHGWTVPKSEENDECGCAFILKPLKASPDGHGIHEPTSQDIGAGGQPISKATGGHEMNVLIDQNMGEDKLPTSHATGVTKTDDVRRDDAKCEEERVKLSGFASTSNAISQAVSQVGVSIASENGKKSSSSPSAKTRPSEESSLSNVSSDSIESAMLKLEEYANKFKWLRGVLRGGDWENTSKPSWELLDSSTSKKPK